MVISFLPDLSYYYMNQTLDLQLVCMSINYVTITTSNNYDNEDNR